MAKDNHRLCQSWFLLQSLLRPRYAPHLHIVIEPKKKQEAEPKSQQINDTFDEFQEALDDIRKFLASKAAKNDTSPESTVLVKPDVLDESKPEVGAITRRNSF